LQRKSDLDVAQLHYAYAAQQLATVLPENVRLHYTYQGERPMLEDNEYVIVHRQGKVIITGMLGPANP